MDILEKQIERRLVQKIKKLGGMCIKLVSPGVAGVPDRMVIYEGKLYFVELKRPGGKPRPLQQKVFRDIGKQGFPVYVLTTNIEVDDFVKGMITDDISSV